MPSPEDYLASLLTSPEQEARNLRASRSKQRMLAFADALRHIGNIYNTTQGANVQQFNDPTTMERTRYQQDKLLRDANNMKYYSYQQQKQAQDLAMQKNQREETKLKLEQRKIALQEAKAQADMQGDAVRAQLIQAQINRIQELLPGEKILQKANIAQKNASAESARASAALNRNKTEHPELYQSGGGGVHPFKTTKKRTVTKTDSLGQPIEWIEETERVGSKGSLLPKNQTGTLLPKTFFIRQYGTRQKRTTIQ